MIRTARYSLTDGGTADIEYDDEAPCLMCGLPVMGASVGGTAVCSWCDCGFTREGKKWTYKEAVAAHARMAEMVKWVLTQE